MSEFTRQQTAEMQRRVRVMLDNGFKLGKKCIICGRRMNSLDCTHTIDENESVFSRIKEEFDASE